MCKYAKNAQKGTKVVPMPDYLFCSFQEIKRLETDGVNEEISLFSYQHFYVIFCTFYMLDVGKKNYLTPCDLSGYSGGCKFSSSPLIDNFH